MADAEDRLADLRQAFVTGEIGPDELRDRLQQLDTNTDREELWARWADQGLFSDPIEQEGFTSRKGKQSREVIPDG